MALKSKANRSLANSGDPGDARFLTRSNFFHFHAVFGKNLAKIIGFCAKFRGWYPLSRFGNPGSTTGRVRQTDRQTRLKILQRMQAAMTQNVSI